MLPKKNRPPPVMRSVVMSLSVRKLDAAVVAEREAVEAVRVMAAVELHKPADHAFGHRPVEALEAAVFHHDTVFDTAADNSAGRVDGRIGTDGLVNNCQVTAYYQRSPQ